MATTISPGNVRQNLCSDYYVMGFRLVQDHGPHYQGTEMGQAHIKLLIGNSLRSADWPPRLRLEVKRTSDSNSYMKRYAASFRGSILALG